MTAYLATCQNPDCVEYQRPRLMEVPAEVEDPTFFCGDCGTEFADVRQVADDYRLPPDNDLDPAPDEGS